MQENNIKTKKLKL